jgi:hypothetical protein
MGAFPSTSSKQAASGQQPFDMLKAGELRSWGTLSHHAHAYRLNPLSHLELNWMYPIIIRLLSMRIKCKIEEIVVFWAH